MTRMTLFAVVLMTAITPAVYSQEPVYFADPNLKRIVEGKLDIPDSDIESWLAKHASAVEYRR